MVEECGLEAESRESGWLPMLNGKPNGKPDGKRKPEALATVNG